MTHVRPHKSKPEEACNDSYTAQASLGLNCLTTWVNGSAQFQEYIDSLGTGSTGSIKHFLPSSQGSMNVNPPLTTSDTTSVGVVGSYSNGSLEHSSKYMDYPTTKPFINSEYTRSSSKAVNAYPTTDRDAVISALRNLQDKVKRLEIERVAAEHNLEALTSNSDKYFDGPDHHSDYAQKPSTTTTKASAASGHSHHTAPSYSSISSQLWKSGRANGETKMSSQTKELEGQLTSAEKRCQLLEKQLDYMKNLVDGSERDRRLLIEKTLKARQERDSAGGDLKLHFDRLNELERDQLRLTATQTLAENRKADSPKSKIREIEKKVFEEKMHRKTLQDKTLELEFNLKNKQTSTSVPTSPPSENVKEPSPVIKTKKPAKKRKKKVPPENHHRPVHHCKSEPMKHYRLNLAEIPFVAGKSTTPSHALGANVQKVLAMMKSHNMALCSQMYANGDCHRSASPASSGSSVSSANQDLTELLGQLQEEFKELSSEHQELLHRLHASVDRQEKGDLEQEIEIIVSRMEAKSQQLSKIRQHQSKMEGKKPRQPSKPSKPKRPVSAGGRLITTSANGYSHKSRNHSSGGNIRARSQSKPVGNSALGKPALYMLRDMKKLQTTLRRDDLCWD